jgi:hypothetical protein
MGLLRRALWTLAAVAVALVVLAAGAAALAWEASPRVAGLPTATAQPLLQLRQQARELLRRHDPRRAEPGRVYVINATPRELELLFGHAAAVLGGAAELSLTRGEMRLQASLPLPWRPPGGWLNLDLTLGDGATLPEVRALSVGALRLPGWLARALANVLLSWLDPGSADAPPLRELLKGVQLRPERVQLVYEWRADVPQRLFARVMPPEQQARLQAYHLRLAEVLRATRSRARVAALLPPLFALAQARTGQGHDAAEENRAALLTLALYATGRPLTRSMPQARAWPRLPWRPVVLRDRIDFSQHYLVSAAIAARAGGPLADVLGLAKEVSDAHDGSGFSFNDMAVNRAGVRLGELAVQSPRDAQARLAVALRDADLVPDVSDLPEFLPEAVFIARFGGLGAPAYEEMVADIEARVAALPLWDGGR